MPYGYPNFPEFPGQHNLDTSYEELITYYKDVKSKYEGTLQSITELSMQLTAYENDMTSRINNIQQVIVPNAVNNAVSTAMMQYQQAIDGSIIELKRQIDSLESELESAENLILQVQTSNSEQITALRQQLESEVNSLNVQIENLTFKLLP